MHALFLLAAAALQPADSKPPAEIVVTGPQRPARKDAQDFVRDVTQRTSYQVPRYHDPVCPAIVGLEADAARVVRERILETAKGVGAEVDPNPRCAANLVLVVDESGRDFVKMLQHKRPDWLEGLGRVDVGNIINEPSPARAWSVTSIRNEDGLYPVTPDYGDTYTIGTKTASILKMPTRAQIEGSVIVIDRSAALGITLAQLADYAAMRGLARTIPPKNKGVRSILNLFEPGSSRETELTRSDIIYLQTLYKSKGTEDVIQQRGRLSTALERDGRSR